MTAEKLFKSIDAPTHSVIVQYEEAGRNLVSQLSAAFEVEKEYKLLHEAQQYSVNLFPNEFEGLKEGEPYSPCRKAQKYTISIKSTIASSSAYQWKR